MTLCQMHPNRLAVEEGRIARAFLPTTERRTTKSLVVIDRSVENYHQLVRAMEGRTEIILLDGDKDAIAQISQALSQTGADSLSIVCHGAPGTLYLGETALNASNIGEHSYLLSEWGVKEIRLYACNIAADEEFMGLLHQYTGANIAASTEKVGNAALGGTSQLENHRGEVSTANKLLSEAIANYPGLLEIEFAPSKDSPIELKDNINYTPVAMGDFNKDGWLDRAVLENTVNPDTFSPSTTVSLELGNGKGKFKPTGGTIELPGNANSIQIGEFDKDGNLDAVLWTSAYNGSDSLNKFTVLKGDGKGKLAIDTTLDVKNVSLLAVTDVNNDGLDDLSLSKYSPKDGREKIEVLLRNNKDFTPASGSPFATNPEYNPVVMGDFNNDGFIDRATSVYDYNSPTPKTTVSIDLGDKKGNFKPLKNFKIELEGSQEGIEIGNFNGDGNVDLAVKTYSWNPETYVGERTFSLLVGDGKGKFTLDTEVPLKDSDYDSRIEDINNDGLDDISINAYISTAGNGIGVYFGKKNGTLGKSTEVKVENPINLVGGGDVNNDGNSDLVVLVGPYEDPKIQVLLGNGKGKFSEGETVELEGNAPATLKLTDINGDKKLDIVAEEFSYNYVDGSLNETSVLLGDGKGSFKPTGTPVKVKTDAKSVVGYFDGDKNLDLVVTRNVYDSYNVNNITSLLSGSGDGKFTLPAKNIKDLKNPQILAAGDFTGDGKVDLLAVTSVSTEETSGEGEIYPVYGYSREDSFEILKGNGQGDFTPVKGSKMKLEQPTGKIIVGDFNGDGKLDVATAQNNYIFYAEDAPTLDAAAVTPEPVAEPVAGDPIARSILPPYPGYGSTISVFLGNGKGNFAPSKNLETKSYGDFALGDFDKDGNIDVAQLNNFSYETTNQFSVLLNQGSVEEPEPKPEATEAVKSAKNYSLKKGEEDLILRGNGKINGTGNELDNEIAGNSKANKLEGLAGDDILTGGKGKDRFGFGGVAAFKKADLGVDIITDFQSAQKDSIILSQTTFDKLESVVGKGFSVIAEFETVNGEKKAETSGAFIVYNQKTGDLFYNANGSQAGFGSGGLFATLEGAPELKESDFSIMK